jgi:vitamin B12 transporter
MTHQTSRDDATGALLQRRAREHAAVSLTRPIEKWQLGIELFANGARFDSINEDPATKMHGYALINLLASYVVNDQWHIKARWNNLVNRDYELAQNYNTPGSNASIVFEYRSR